MSDHLSNSIDDWPIDPRELLGVSQTAEKREIRRAYSKLIKQYRPDDSPQEFQKIREAYDSLLAQLEFQAEVIRLGGEPVEFSTDEQTGRMTIDMGAARAKRSTSSEIDDFWDRFDQDPKALYQQLVVKTESASGHAMHAEPDEKLFLKLYWALQFDPSLDAQDPSAWLAKGLSRLGLDSAGLLAMYSQTLVIEPDECMSTRCNDLLTCQGSVDARCAFLFRRWKALGQLQQWNQIVSDIIDVRDRIRIDDPVQWGRLILSLTNPLFRVPVKDATGLRSRVRYEISEISEFHFQLDSDLNHFDSLNELAKELPPFNRLTKDQAEIVRAVRDSVSEDYLDMQEQLWDLANKWQGSPRDAIEVIDDLIQVSPTSVLILLRQMEVLRYTELAESEPTTGVTEQVADFITRNGKKRYGYLRLDILEFCIEECLHPSEFHSAISDLSPKAAPPVEHLLHAVENDLSLLCVCMGCQASVVNA